MEEANQSPSTQKLTIIEKPESSIVSAPEVCAGSWFIIETKPVEFHDFLGPPRHLPPQREDTVPEENLELKRRRIEREVNLTLRLYENPWKIRKILTRSDVNDHLCRLIVPRQEAEEHILGVWGDDTRARQAKSECGASVRVWDCNTASEHELLFKLWRSCQSYVFTKTWKQNFVSRRGLKEGDEVGMYWDSATSRFYFVVFTPQRHA